MISGYKIIDQIYSGSKTKVYRSIDEAKHLPVVIKVLTATHPTFEQLIQFRHQYTIAEHLHHPQIIETYSLEPYQNGYALIVEDYGGISLREWSGLGTGSFASKLKIAIDLTIALQELGQQRIIHKDINPANILIHPVTAQVKLIDFSIASLLPKSTLEICNPNVLEGTLAYIAPEQTGRMNRGIDYRCDFYSLGVTLFELFTGELPFHAEDPLGWVHCHLAQVAIPACQIDRTLPIAVSKIIAKLMAKNAEERYQTAVGIKYDLEECLRQWQETGAVIELKIGERDHGDRFIIPDRLYGRELEVQTLLDAFGRVTTGSSELVLVAGCSGIGKTAVINEVHQPITLGRGYFIKGKFDQFNRNIPLSAFVLAFRDLIGQLLSECDVKLANWQRQILAAVGENGRILIEVIPELEQIIGVQPPVVELARTAAEHQFNWLFQKFMQVFASAEHPLTIFLDDLQWADLASLQLLQLSNESNSYLLLLGAYRNNEVSSAHPLMLTIAELQQAGKIVQKIDLNPLTFDDLNRLVADTLHCSIYSAKPLAELVDRKTKGNPFFTTQFLKALYTEGAIEFTPPTPPYQEGAFKSSPQGEDSLTPSPFQGEGWGGVNISTWSYNLDRIQTLFFSEDVVEFMTVQLQKLPIDTQSILKLAACIGDRFDLYTLAIVSKQVSSEIEVNLWQALAESLILPIANSGKFSTESNPHPIAYKFSHDRVQQAAYELIPATQKQSTHLEIGRLLLGNTLEIDLESQIFIILNHLNIGRSLITQPVEQNRLVQLNLIAAQKAKVSTAYTAASQHLEICIELLPADSWQTQTELTRSIYELAAEAAYLSANYPEMTRLVGIFIAHTDHSIDKIRMCEIQMLGAKAQGQLQASIEIGLQSLQLLGVEFPATPTPADIHAALGSTLAAWQDRLIASLEDLPLMSDRADLAAMRIITQMIAPAYQSAPMLMSLLIFAEVNLCIAKGNCEVSAFAYADYGVVLCGIVDDLDAGYQFGQLALNILDKFQSKAYRCRTNFIVRSYISHWQESLSSQLPFFRSAYQLGIEVGDLESAALNAKIYCAYAYYSGNELSNLATEMATYRQGLLQLKQETALNYQAIYHQTVLNLLGQSDDPCQLVGEVYSEPEMLSLLERSNNRTALYYLHHNKTVLYYLFGAYPQAATAAKLGEAYADSMAGMFAIPLSCYYSALIDLKLYQSSDIITQAQYLEQIAIDRAKLQRWAEYAPMNHLHRVHLIDAELHRVSGDQVDAIESYDLAIELAHANNYIQDEALANQLAAEFYLDWGKPKIAAVYMQSAYYCYVRWGAKAKIDDLVKRYPQLLAPILQSQKSVFNSLPSLVTYAETKNSTSQNITNLDLASVIQSAQVLSSKIELAELIEKLSHIILKNSGAEICLLALPDANDNWQIRSSSIITTTGIATTELCQSLVDNINVPSSLIYWVKNTKSTSIFNARQPLVIDDAYLREHQPLSVFCLPILKQEKVLGVLYLEHRHNSDIFTENTKTVISFLCAQAAIAIDNATLYQHSQMMESALRKSDDRYFQLLSNIPAALYQFELTADGIQRMNYLSPRFSEMFELLDLAVMTDISVLFDRIVPEDRAEFYESIQISAKSGQNWRWEGRMFMPIENTIKWFRGESTPKYEPNGSILWDGILMDITERKNAERKLKFTQFAVDNSAEGISLLKPDGSFSYVNQAMCRMLDYSAAELTAMHIWDIDNRATPDNWQEHWQDLKKTGGFAVESHHHDRHGKRYPVKLSLNFFEYEGEEYNFAMVSDITEAKAAELALRQSEERYQQLSDNVPGMVYQFRLAPDGGMTFPYVSSGSLDLFELEPAVVMANFSCLMTIMHPDDIAGFQKCVEISAQNMTLKVCEARSTLSSGVTKWIRSISRPELQADGAIIWDGVMQDVTAEKIAQQELFKSQQQMQAFIDNSSAAMYLKDLEGRYLIINQTCVDLAGGDAQLFLGETDDAIFPPDIAKQVRENDRAVIQSGISRILEESIIDPSGIARTYISNKFVLTDEAGKPYALGGVSTEITDLKQAEIALRESEKRYQKLADNVPGVIYQFRIADGIVTFPYMSSGSIELFELEPTEIVADSNCLMGTIHPDDLAEFSEIVAASAQNMTSKLWEGRIVLGSGTTKWIKSASRPELQPDGAIVWDGMMIDITAQRNALEERNRAQAELATSQQKYYNLIQSINGVVWEYDLANDRFSFVSDRAGSLFGYPISDWLTQTDFWQSHIDPADRDVTVRVYNDAIKHHYDCEFEYRIVAADGRVIWIYDVSTLIYDPDGNPIATTGLFIDISDLKQIEHQLQQSNERLELTIEELERATRLKDEFLATMSHELRTPLNAILGMSEALIEEVFGDLNPRQLNSVSTIEQSGEHLLSLINDILDVSKISAGKLELHLTEVSPIDLCKSSLVFITQQAVEKQIQIETHLDPTLTHISVDERRMRQVLINLLNNAVKFTPTGGKISLSLKLETADNCLYFAISDTGIGISSTDIAKLFQPFIQVDSSLSRKYEGTGLGLVLVKQIVELHGGTVSIESEVGTGSRFTIKIPTLSKSSN